MEFYIDFSCYCIVEADSKEEAEEKFWNGLQEPSVCSYDSVYDIDSIEEKRGVK